ncbi:substrate-binding domain-containing protein [Glutamicibacter bergerei]|uniref:Substrate-binding domain-containing protein n=1 Tax=Glutamicibacter bergerei TaxID=256702 RepID=A0ABV9MKY0_9MICC|nr:substrate-binding domain-containing protein [Glutamicibacter sp. BW77]PCC36060.1 sugar ABC transporter substrate-binding protein [Glutamicibacter sp. BW77]HBV10758.1 sugar ABC transporter substrate-binding protein [Micrococcaceae bacterium]
MFASIKGPRKMLGAAALLATSAFMLTSCVSNSPAPSNESSDAQNAPAAAGANAEEGKKVTIGLSVPAADHGFMAAMTDLAVETAKDYPDVELKVSEGTNDVSVQISQVETMINDKVDAIVLLPFDGAALTKVAQKAMDAGIPVINVDREFSTAQSSRVTVLGDNYGVGVSAGDFICAELGDKKDAKIGEIPGIDSLPLTQERSEGFKDALAKCGLEVSNRVPAEFTVESGERAASNLLQAAPHLDAIWNHDDDQGVGVLAAIKAADRSEFFMVGNGGSANMMREIQSGDSVVKATTVYPAYQAADGVRMARLVAQERSLEDLLDIEIPRKVVLYAAVVTKDNVEKYLPTAFES